MFSRTLTSEFSDLHERLRSSRSLNTVRIGKVFHYKGRLPHHNALGGSHVSLWLQKKTKNKKKPKKEKKLKPNNKSCGTVKTNKSISAVQACQDAIGLATFQKKRRRVGNKETRLQGQGGN